MGTRQVRPAASRVRRQELHSAEQPVAAGRPSTGIRITGRWIRDVHRRRTDLYWNAYVAIGQMGGQGTFSDPRINLAIVQKPDLVSSKLSALFAYQLSLLAPAPPPGSFNAAAAIRGERVFSGKGNCASCHPGPTFTDVSSGADPAVPVLHDPVEVDQKPAYAARSATEQYRATPLRGVWQHPPYFHDGSAADLLAVVNHYDRVFKLNLSASQKVDLVEYLKSL